MIKWLLKELNNFLMGSGWDLFILIFLSYMFPAFWPLFFTTWWGLWGIGCIWCFFAYTSAIIKEYPKINMIRL